MTDREGLPAVMMPYEVAELLKVDPKTVTRWAAAGKLPCITTPGGHRRFKREVVLALLRGELSDGED